MFSREWDRCYSEHMQLSVWPWSDIVSLIHRHCKQTIATKGRVLELGCGAGANIPLFLALGMDYYGIEGSKSIVNQLNKRHPSLANKIIVGDFTLEQSFNLNFDLVFDRAALTHNNTSSIIRTLAMVSRSLKPGGVFIGSDWFSTNHSDFSIGELCDDLFTKQNFPRGQFTGVGKVHFSDESHLRDLFLKYEIIYLEEKIIRRYVPQDSHQIGLWNIVARKRHD